MRHVQLRFHVHPALSWLGTRVTETCSPREVDNPISPGRLCCVARDDVVSRAHRVAISLSLWSRTPSCFDATIFLEPNNRRQFLPFSFFFLKIFLSEIFSYGWISKKTERNYRTTLRSSIIPHFWGWKLNNLREESIPGTG